MRTSFFLWIVVVDCLNWSILLKEKWKHLLARVPLCGGQLSVSFTLRNLPFQVESKTHNDTCCCICHERITCTRYSSMVVHMVNKCAFCLYYIGCLYTWTFFTHFCWNDEIHVLQTLADHHGKCETLYCSYNGDMGCFFKIIKCLQCRF